MCYAQNFRKSFYFMLIVMAIALLTSCINHESSEELISSEELVQPDLRYVVSLSRSREPIAKLLFFKENGEQYRELDYKGSSINSLNYFDNTFIMHSNRTNEHYRLNASNGFEAFSLTSTKSEFRDSPSWFAISDKTCLIETINFGMRNGGEYLSSVIYDCDGEKREVLLKWEYLNSGINTKDKIFVESYNDELKRHGIVVINKEKEEATKVYFKNDFTSLSNRLVLWKDKIITYGSNTKSSEKKVSALGMVDMETLDTKEKLFENEEILIVYAVGDMIKVVTDQKNVYSLNQKLEEIGKESLKNSEFVDYYMDENFVLRKILDTDNTISVLYTSKSFDKENIGFILEYHKVNLKVEKKTDIILKNANDWMGEVVDFIMVNP